LDHIEEDKSVAWRRTRERKNCAAVTLWATLQAKTAKTQ